jgi:DNA-binding NtrC family response regulator
MAYKILIVDDDLIFSNLLADVFKQAGYDVQNAVSADEALSMLGGIKVDLIVTDQRMPGTSGTEFVRKIMQKHKDLPMIMVSGFLSSGDIRGLITDGVGGIFIKPLNIFQLLKRVAQLIDRRENQKKPKMGEADGKSDAREESLVSLKGARSARAIKFLKQLESLRSFTSNLLLVGHEGTNFDVLCQDLSDPNCDTIFNVLPEDLDSPDALASRMSGLAQQGQGRLTIVIDKVDEINPQRAEAIFSVARCKGPFDKLGQRVRFIFCLRAKLDDLFDAGRIDENLYLFMGTMELNVPSLGELAEDIPAIAQAMLERMQGFSCRLDEAAAAALRDFDWPGGSKQLETVLAEAAAATSGSLVDEETVRAAYEGRLLAKDEEKKEELRDYLVKCRAEYVEAVTILTGGDERAVCGVLEIDAALLHSIRANQGASPP